MTSALHRHLPQVRDSLPSDLLASLPTSSQYSRLHLAQPVLDGECYTLLPLDKTCVCIRCCTVIDRLILGFVAIGLLSWHRAFWQHNAPQQYISCWQGKNHILTLSPREEPLHFIVFFAKTVHPSLLECISTSSWAGQGMFTTITIRSSLTERP